MAATDARCATVKGPRTRSLTRTNSIRKRVIPAKAKYAPKTNRSLRLSRRQPSSRQAMVKSAIAS